MKILIMAGGKGTRLWPLSRVEKPKQFQKLISDKTMLQETVWRMLPLGGWSDVYISTASAYVDEVKRELPRVLSANIIAEPLNRERASSLALSCAFFSKRCRNETIVALPADHLIKKPKALIAIVKKAEETLKRNPDYIITVGIKPRVADTGLGYVKRGRVFSRSGGSAVYQAAKFVEKPDLKTARRLIKDGNYFWNSGIYLFKAPNLLEKFKKFVPDTYKRVLAIGAAVDTKDYAAAVAKEYPKTDPVSFEYSIVENDHRILVIPGDFGWSDIGSWAVLKDSLVKRSNKNYVKAAHLDIGSRDLLVYGSPGKLIATVGLKGLVVVDTTDVILICDKSRSQEVRKIVNMLEKREGNKRL